MKCPVCHNYFTKSHNTMSSHVDQCLNGGQSSDSESGQKDYRSIQEIYEDGRSCTVEGLERMSKESQTPSQPESSNEESPIMHRRKHDQRHYNNNKHKECQASSSLGNMTSEPVKAQLEQHHVGTMLSDKTSWNKERFGRSRHQLEGKQSSSGKKLHPPQATANEVQHGNQLFLNLSEKVKNPVKRIKQVELVPDESQMASRKKQERKIINPPLFRDGMDKDKTLSSSIARFPNQFSKKGSSACQSASQRYGKKMSTKKFPLSSPNWSGNEEVSMHANSSGDVIASAPFVGSHGNLSVKEFEYGVGFEQNALDWQIPLLSESEPLNNSSLSGASLPNYDMVSEDYLAEDSLMSIVSMISTPSIRSSGVLENSQKSTGFQPLMHSRREAVFLEPYQRDMTGITSLPNVHSGKPESSLMTDSDSARKIITGSTALSSTTKSLFRLMGTEIELKPNNPVEPSYSVDSQDLSRSIMEPSIGMKPLPFHDHDSYAETSVPHTTLSSEYSAMPSLPVAPAVPSNNWMHGNPSNWSYQAPERSNPVRPLSFQPYHSQAQVYDPPMPWNSTAVGNTQTPFLQHGRFVPSSSAFSLFEQGPFSNPSRWNSNVAANTHMPFPQHGPFIPLSSSSNSFEGRPFYWRPPGPY